MGDGFEVDAEGILHAAIALREQASALDAAGGAIPEADAGVMTAAIESAVGALLSQIGLLGSALVDVADTAELAALDYHRTDLAAQADLARLLLPGATDREIADAVKRADRADEIELAQLMPGDPEAATQAVVDSPSQWEEAEQRFEERTQGLRDLLLPGAPDEGPQER
ncbi:hypothetical protein GCM10027062_28780 [Nocardioides hungaricus]